MVFASVVAFLVLIAVIVIAMAVARLLSPRGAAPARVAMNVQPTVAKGGK